LPRVKGGPTTRRRHNKVLAITKGQRASRHSLYRRAHQAMVASLVYTYRHRRERKGDMRRLWILRINAAVRARGLTYGRFMDGLKKAEVDINRKMLANMAITSPADFANLVTLAKGKSPE